MCDELGAVECFVSCRWIARVVSTYEVYDIRVSLCCYCYC